MTGSRALGTAPSVPAAPYVAVYKSWKYLTHAGTVQGSGARTGREEHERTHWRMHVAMVRVLWQCRESKCRMPGTGFAVDAAPNSSTTRVYASTAGLLIPNARPGWHTTTRLQ